ncbi:MAG: SPOR domain-containing protein [Prevotella sp.]|nr:SPOR domain-containing protein [Prevotella sp.]
MKRLVIIATLCVGCAAANAQTFTQRLQKSNAGEGKVTVTQSKEIDDLVNGPQDVITQSSQSTQKTQTTPTTPTTQKSPDTQKQAGEKEKSQKPERPQITTQSETTIDTTYTDEPRKKVLKGYKVNGYRVQVYAGGNSRDARIKAEKTGREINALFPGEPVYVHFYSPRWICRMGNYRTYEEAHQILNAVKKLGYKSAIIVKGKITVPYLPADQTPSSNP